MISLIDEVKKYAEGKWSELWDVQSLVKTHEIGLQSCQKDMSTWMDDMKTTLLEMKGTVAIVDKVVKDLSDGVELRWKETTELKKKVVKYREEVVKERNETSLKYDIIVKWFE